MRIAELNKKFSGKKVLIIADHPFEGEVCEFEEMIPETDEIPMRMRVSNSVGTFYCRNDQIKVIEEEKIFVQKNLEIDFGMGKVREQKT